MFQFVSKLSIPENSEALRKMQTQQFRHITFFQEYQSN